MEYYQYGNERTSYREFHGALLYCIMFSYFFTKCSGNFSFMKYLSTSVNSVLLVPFFVLSFTIGCGNSDQTPPTEETANKSSASEGMSIEQEVSPDLLRQAAYNGKKEIIETGVRQDVALDAADGM
jgi:hypothetical protein